MSAPEGFTEFVVARQASLLRTAYLLAGNAHDAEDLVQAALIKVVPHWRRIRDDPEPYVRQVLVRENVSRWRRRRWREETSGVLPEPAPGRTANAPDHDELLALRAALGLLAPRQRAVLVLRYYEGMTERETADVLGIGIGTVKSHARDGLSRLRSHLDTDDGAELATQALLPRR